MLTAAAARVRDAAQIAGHEKRQEKGTGTGAGFALEPVFGVRDGH